jgi:catechol 2,3-dioxygenase-like lactoylglutathione lyase family enzyme
MTVEVIGVDHIFVAVGNLGRSEEFYDPVMSILGFRKGEGTIGGDPHLFYYNRQFAYSLRPAREGTPGTTRTRPGYTTSASGWWTRPLLTARLESCGRRG